MSLNFPRSLAVVIGIDDYQHIRRLTTAVHDATRLGTLLREEHAYDEVFTLTSDVTLARLHTFFVEILSTQVKADDRLLIYFAGHGIALDGEDGPEGYLIPQDARADNRSSFLAMSDLYSWLEELTCRHLLVILDCCFAGAFTWYRRRNLRPVRDTLYREHYDRFLREPAWQVLTSAAYDQEALDVLAGKPIGERGATGSDGVQHSPFASALFNALAGAGDLIPKGVGDGVVTATELYLYLRESVEMQARGQANHAQTPELWPFSRQKHGKGEYIFLVPGHGEPLLPPAPSLSASNNPYRGLEPYNEEHADLFFGRGEQVNQLAAHVATHPLTVVLGASGTGKSSLVKAGLIPYLKRSKAGTQNERNPVGPCLFILPPIRPGDTPLRVLTDLLSAQVGEHASPEPNAILATVEYWLTAHPEQTLLLVIDQCEELFTLSRHDDERKALLDILAALLALQEGRIRLVLTLRTDFEPQFANLQLAPYWQAARFVVRPLSQAELREVIELPAAQHALFFDPPELVDRLIDEVIQTPGALPLLSFTLSELYRCYLARQAHAQLAGELLERTLTATDYQTLGGVIGSLRMTADAVYNDLDPAHQATMQRAMLRMVAVEGGDLARRRVPRAELEYPTGAENERVRAILERLVDARLLVAGHAVTDSDGAADEYFEPAHDALVRAWDKLLVWKRAADEYLPLQRRLTVAASEWAGASQPSKAQLLWNDDPRLPQVIALLSRHQPAQPDRLGFQQWWQALQSLFMGSSFTPIDNHWLNQNELTFVQQSIELQLRNRRRLVGTVSGVIATLSLLLIAALFFWQQSERQQRVARAGELTAQARVALVEDNPDLALLLAIEAITTTVNAGEPHIPEAEEALRASLAQMDGYVWESGHGAGNLDTFFAINSPGTGGITRIRFSPDGRWLTTAGDDGTVRLQEINNLSSPPKVLTINPDHAVDAIAYSADGRLLLTKSWDQALLWDTQTLTVTNHISGFNPWTNNTIDLSYDGRWITSESWGGDLQLWARTMPNGPSLSFTETTSVGFSANRQWLALGEIGKIGLWKLAEMTAPVAEITLAPETEINALTVSSDGNWIVASQADKTLAWELSHRAPNSTTLFDGEEDISSLAISPDSQWVAIALTNGATYLWSLRDRAASRITLKQPNKQIDLFLADNPAGLIRFSPDSRLLVTNGDQSNTAAVWSLANLDDAPMILHGHMGGPSSISPDSRWLAMSSEANVRLWDLSQRSDDRSAAFRSLSSPMYEVTGLEISADSQWLGIGNLDGKTRLWNLFDPTRTMVVLETPEDVPDNEIYSVAISSNGRWLATGGADHNVRLYAMDDLAATPTVLSGQAGSVRTLAFSPDNRWLVSAGADQMNRDSTARVWNLEAIGSAPVVLAHHEGEILQVLFSPDSRHLALSSVDETISVWAMQDLTQTPRVYQQGFSVSALAFSPDSRWLATGSGDPYGDTNFDDTNVRLWDLTSVRTTPTKILSGLSGHISDIVFSPNGHWVAAGSKFGNLRLWQLSDLNASSVVLSGHTGDITDLAISADSRWLVSGSDDATTRVWDLDNLDSPSVRLPVHPTGVDVVAISPDGRWLATGGAWNTIRLWPLRIEELITIACQTVGRNFTYEEWQARFAQSATRLTCSNHPVHGSFIAEARVIADAGDYAGAEAQYRLARSLDPNLAFEPAQELAQILSSRGIQRARAGQFEDALTLLRQAKRYDPSLAINPVATVRALQNRYNAEELNKQGEQLAGQEAYDQALEHFSQAIALEPNELPEAYYNRGLVYAIVQNDAAALLDYSQALALDYRPAIDVYIHRAYAYFAQKEYQNALNDFSTAAKLHPTAENHNRVCWYGALGGFAQEVLAACEQAVASAPNHGGYRDSRGLARALTGDREGAIEDFEFFIRWKKEHGDYTQNVKKREEWIAALIQGKSPFTAQVIVELHSE